MVMKKRRVRNGQRLQKTIEIEIRQEWVFTYKLQGNSDRQIAARLKNEHGITISHVQVNRDWKAAMKARADENTEEFQEYRQVTNGQYQYLLSHLMPMAIAGNIPAANAVGRYIKGIRELNGLDRELGSEENPLHVQVDGQEYDLSKLTREELETLATLDDKAKVIPFPRANAS